MNKLCFYFEKIIKTMKNEGLIETETTGVHLNVVPRKRFMFRRQVHAKELNLKDERFH